LAWTISWRDTAKKELSRLDKSVQKRIAAYLKERVALDPKSFGKPLRSNLKGLWRYRVDDYRILCRIEDAQLVVLVITVGHRKDVYET